MAFFTNLEKKKFCRYNKTASKIQIWPICLFTEIGEIFVHFSCTKAIYFDVQKKFATFINISNFVFLILVLPQGKKLKLPTLLL